MVMFDSLTGSRVPEQSCDTLHKFRFKPTLRTAQCACCDDQVCTVYRKKTEDDCSNSSYSGFPFATRASSTPSFILTQYDSCPTVMLQSRSVRTGPDYVPAHILHTSLGSETSDESHTAFRCSLSLRWSIPRRAERGFNLHLSA